MSARGLQRRPLSRAEAQLLNIAMLAALGGIAADDLPALGDEVSALLRGADLDGSDVQRLAMRLDVMAKSWRRGLELRVADFDLRRECAAFFRARYVRARHAAEA